jgi:hypothetical protein
MIQSTVIAVRMTLRARDYYPFGGTPSRPPEKDLHHL